MRGKHQNDRMPADMSDKMSDRLLEKMPENMSDKMPGPKLPDRYRGEMCMYR